MTSQGWGGHALVIAAGTLAAPSAWAAFDDAAFESGAGQSGADLRLAITAIVITLAFVWSAWLAIGAFRGWSEGTMHLGEAMMTILRGFIVLALIGAFVR